MSTTVHESTTSPAAASDAARVADSATPVPADEFWSGTRIAEFADKISIQLGAEENALQRTMYLALTDAHFMPIATYSTLLLARRALVGTAMMTTIASCAPPVDLANIAYAFDVGPAKGASRLVEIWTVRVDGEPKARFMLAPTETRDADMERAEATLRVFSIKIKSDE